MEILLAKSAGFCFGVKRALTLTERAVTSEKGPIGTLGPLVHNRMVTDYLKELGVYAVNEVDEVQSGCLVIRAHGVPPGVFARARNKGIRIVDATCPYVKKAQTWAKELHDEGYQVVIIGESDHAEVNGLIGWAEGEALVVEKREDAQNIAPGQDIGILVQTTQKASTVEEMVDILEPKSASLKVHHTICKATQERQEETADLAKQVDVMLVVGGRNSANTKRLAAISSAEGARSYHIESAEDIKGEWFLEANRVGVTGGASTPEWIIKGVMDRMEEQRKDEELAKKEERHEEDQEKRCEEESQEEKVSLEKQEEEEDKQEEDSETVDSTEEMGMEDVEKAYEKTFINLQEGDIVRGTVVQVGQDEALVDVGGYKTEGVIPLQELVNIWMNSPEEMIQKGEEIDVYVVSVEDQDGKLVLSKKQADEEKAMEKIKKAYDEDELITGVVKEVVKGGLLADIGLRAFIPASHAADRYVEDLESLVGEEMAFKIIEMEPKKRRVVLSRRKAIEKETARRQKETLENLEEGQVIEGEVKRITDFGAFVDVGGIDGLLHISEMSWGRIKHPSEVLSIGETIEVEVLGVNRESGRISLGRKQVLPNPWEEAAENYPEGSIIEGKVVRFTNFGAFIEIEPGIDGLLHISQISNKRVAKPEDVLDLEQTVEVKVISQNPKEKKIGLSMIEVEQDRAKEDYQRFIASQNEDSENVTIGDMMNKDSQEEIEDSEEPEEKEEEDENQKKE